MRVNFLKTGRERTAFINAVRRVKMLTAASTIKPSRIPRMVEQIRAERRSAQVVGS